MLKCCFTLVNRENFAIFRDPQFAENPKTRDQSNIQLVQEQFSPVETYLQRLSNFACQTMFVLLFPVVLMVNYYGEEFYRHKLGMNKYDVQSITAVSLLFIVPSYCEICDLTGLCFGLVFSYFQKPWSSRRLRSCLDARFPK